jgi:nucleoside-diphosphate-sugar epimerase
MRLNLVTGGAGFIGCNLVRALLRRGQAVRVLDNFSTGKRENLEGLDVDVVEGGLEHTDDVIRAVRGVTHVFHLGALPSVARSVEDPISSDAANDIGTLNLLAAARDAGVERLVFSSSSSVYGETPTLPKREGEEGRPISPYAISKQAGEYYCRLFHRLYGLPTVMLRYFNIFGPRQDPESHYAAVIPRFVTAILTGRAPTIFGDGGQSRDFTFVGDAVQANLKAAEAAPEACGEAFNVAYGGRITLLELLEEIADILGTAVVPEHAPPRDGDIRHSQADIGKAETLLGYRPENTVRQGLEQTVEWFRRIQ